MTLELPSQWQAMGGSHVANGTWVQMWQGIDGATQRMEFQNATLQRAETDKEPIDFSIAARVEGLKAKDRIDFGRRLFALLTEAASAVDWGKPEWLRDRTPRLTFEVLIGEAEDD
jgi:hypothetical protein